MPGASQWPTFLSLPSPPPHPLPSPPSLPASWMLTGSYHFGKFSQPQPTQGRSLVRSSDPGVVRSARNPSHSAFYQWGWSAVSQVAARRLAELSPESDFLTRVLPTAFPLCELSACLCFCFNFFEWDEKRQFILIKVKIHKEVLTSWTWSNCQG